MGSGGFLRTRVALLAGESAHGVAEFDEVKVRLVRFLHERLGYDVLAFESPLVECTTSGWRARELTPRALMERCVWGVWRVREVLPLFAYVKATTRRPGPLRLAGVDVQTGASTAAAERPAFFSDIVGRADPAYARRVFALDSTVVAGVQAVWPGSGRAWEPPESEGEAVRAGYDSLTRWLTAHDAALRAAGNAPQRLLLARQAARALARFVPSSPGSRDRGMAENVAFLLDSLYPGRKVILWAHNAHVRHHTPNVAFLTDARPRSMGSWLAEARRREVYTVGVYMHGGRTWVARDGEVPVRTPEPGSLEALLHATGYTAAFLPVGGVAGAPDGAWLHAPVVTWDWGRTRDPLVLAAEYDAVLFVDHVRPPVHLPPEPAVAPPTPGVRRTRHGAAAAPGDRERPP